MNTDFLNINYSDFAQKIYDTNIFTDAWIDGKERFGLEPVILSKSLYKQLNTAAESICKAYQELTEIVNKNPIFVDDYFYLTPYQKLMWLSSSGFWHGIARMDLFILNDGSIKTAELNSDTPSGEAEAVIFNELIHNYYSKLINPNVLFKENFLNLIDYYNNTKLQNITKPVIAIIYPTEMTEDLSMISLYQQWLENCNYDVILASPYNITTNDKNEIFIFDKKIDIIFRHYKTDWWGERIPVFDDVFFNDTDPLDYQLISVIESEINNNVSIINPFGSVLTQNKLSLAFFWDKIFMFSKTNQNIIKKYIPETHRLIDFNTNNINKDDWVLKTNYGCEGSEVIIGRYSSQEIWNKTLETAVKKYWIIQKYFDALPLQNNKIPNYGIYLFAGKSNGIFTRLSEQATDFYAISVPTFIEN